MSNKLPAEILQNIYLECGIEEALNLAQTSQKNYRIFNAYRMPILQKTMNNSYGPIRELVQLVISNEPEKTRRPMGTELRRNNTVNRIIETPDTPKLTIELIKKMVQYGKIAEKWIEVYPRLRWRFGSSNRRLLRGQEKERLRRALYIWWCYTTLFHDRTYTQFAPDAPIAASQDDPRLRLLRTYPGTSLAQLSEFHFHVMQVIEIDLYPSNQVILDHYSYKLPWKTLEKLAWGDRGNEYWRLVRCIMKFNPRDLLHLVEHTNTKTQRAEFLHVQGAYFIDAPETLNDTLRLITVERANEAKAQSDMSKKVPYCPSLAMVRDGPQEDIEYWGGHETGIVDVCQTEMAEADARRSANTKNVQLRLSISPRGLGALFSDAGTEVGDD